MPYRSERKREVAERPEAGPVAEMVRQFADPHAFVRELVQNSIDAGATAIVVRVERSGGSVTTSVQDDGAGMDRAVIEGPLLTLFNSSKEGDSSKIGKYGVGFVSVFAVDPEVVEIDTWRDGACHRVRLFRDHRYELERLAPRAGNGTIVSLHQTMETARFEEHRARIEGALLRWCRYAAVPIELHVSDPDRAEGSGARRIDGPLGVPAPIFVETHRGGQRIVVGPSAGSERFCATAPAPEDPAWGKPTFAGFYNRGLTLFETTEPLLPGLEQVRFRVDSPHLRHTLSRDNVLRDRAFHGVLSQVRDLVRGSLARELGSRLARAARDLAKAKPPYDEDVVLSYVALLEAACAPPLVLPKDEVVLPLVAAWEGKHVASEGKLFKRKEMFVAPLADELGRALAQIGEPVVLVPHPTIVSSLSARGPLPGPLAVEKHWLLLHELSNEEITKADGELCLGVQKALRGAGIRVDRVALARLSAAVAAPCVLVQGDVRCVGVGVWLCRMGFADRGWAEERVRGGLLLDVTHEAVLAARERAREDAFVAAHLLARILLLSREDPSGKVSDSLFEASAKVMA
ncbi:ATP-binding protein [Polyangium jinanense]|uniref:ATP-binding protein n=1 Tax=Polyangium jinanense TaxID=2829994 RepID=A0A9X3X2Q5_9BACT|nr:ATP-binding protein [Polyangium jinanense]MDC3983124.1 ATP-binding protein [Polyangium jinanense]